MLSQFTIIFILPTYQGMNNWFSLKIVLLLECIILITIITIVIVIVVKHVDKCCVIMQGLLNLSGDF